MTIPSFANMKSGGDAVNMAEAGSMSGNANSAGAGVGTGVLGSMGLGVGLSNAMSGDALTGQAQGASGGSVADNTAIGDININT